MGIVMHPTNAKGGAKTAAGVKATFLPRFMISEAMAGGEGFAFALILIMVSFSQVIIFFFDHSLLQESLNFYQRNYFKWLIL